MKQEMTEEQRTLLRSLGAALFGGPAPEIPCDDPLLWREASQQAVFLLASNDVDLSGLPAQVRREMRETAKACLARDLRIARGHAEISRLLECAQIPHVMIKGLVSALWYPRPELRQLGDIDLYVEPQDVPRADELLKKQGYVPYKTSHSIHRVYFKDGCRYELHFEIPGMPDGNAGDVCREIFLDMIARSEMTDTPFGEMRVPSSYHQGVMTLLHMAHHLTNSGVGLRHLCDWAVYVAGISEAELAALCDGPLARLGLRRFAGCLTDICVRYLGCPERQISADETLSDALLADLLSGGNFGQKSISRTRQAYLITSGSKHRSKTLHSLSLLRDMVVQKWPEAKKHKILIPIGFVRFSLQYAFRVAAGRRPGLYADQTLRGARDRTRLYDKLKLFEKEKETGQ